MKSYSSKEIIKIISDDGWYRIDTVGDHYHYKHPTKKGKITVTHPVKDIPIKTLLSIFKIAGINIH